MAKSRNELYLEALLDGNTETPVPQSRMEACLKALIEVCLPNVTEEDNGKIPMVKDGAWSLVLIANAEEGEY